MSSQPSVDELANALLDQQIQRGRKDLDDPNLTASWHERGRVDARPAHDAVLRAALSEDGDGHRRALTIFEAYTRDLGDGGRARRGSLVHWILNVKRTEWQQAFLNPDFMAARDAYIEAFIARFDELMMEWKATPFGPPPFGPDVDELWWLNWLGADDPPAAAEAQPARRGLRRFLPR